MPWSGNRNTNIGSSRAKLNANPNTQPMQWAILIQLWIPMEIAINPKLGEAAPAMLSDDPRRPVDQISRDPGIPAGFLKVWLKQINLRMMNHNLDVAMDRYWPGGR